MKGCATELKVSDGRWTRGPRDTVKAWQGMAVYWRMSGMSAIEWDDRTDRGV